MALPRFVRDASNNKVFANQGGSYYHIPDPETANQMFGSDWGGFTDVNPEWFKDKSVADWRSMPGLSNPNLFEAAQRPTDINPWVPETPSGVEEILTGGVNLSDAFDAFNLPSYTGPMAAPITEGMFSALQGIKNTTNADPIGQSSEITNAISSMLSGEGFAAAGLDPNSVMAKFRPNVEGLDEMLRTGFQTIQEGDVPYSNTGRSDEVINSILSGRANENVDPRTRQMQDAMLSAFITASGAPRFDNTQLFRDLTTVFEGDLADQTAELQEQFSSLGLAPGSTDRLNKIASNAGQARARHSAMMGDIASRSFEAAENRRLQAIASAAGVGDVLNTGVANAASVIPAIMSNERLPFDQKMQFVAQVLEPAAGRRAAGVNTQADLSNAAMERYAAERRAADRAREAAVQAGVATRGQDIEQRGQGMQAANNLFNAESLLRQGADDEAVRQYEEFVRTQGGGFDQMIQFLNALPEGTVAVGPSTASQVGTVAGQVVNNLPELIQTGQVIWDNGRKIWDWATNR
jgi:hypothetical protein